MNILNELYGKTIRCIEGAEQDSGSVGIEFDDDTKLTFHHHQDCCERVFVEDVCGNPDSLLGSILLQIEENESKCEDCPESGTWTFYKIKTSFGQLDIRWLGESNGYYSESVAYEVSK